MEIHRGLCGFAFGYKLYPVIVKIGISEGTEVLFFVLPLLNASSILI